jgi:hypothetical protein
MKAIKTKLSEVKLNPNNPRLIKDDNFKKLVQSIKDFPEMLDIRPIVVNADMVILGGNMRFKACKEAGLKEVPIIVADNLTEEQQREFLIKDNVSGGEWDWSLLAEWDTEQLEEWGLEVPKSKEEIEIQELFDIQIPIYTASEDKPNESELVNLEKYSDLINQIDNSDIDKSLKEILKIRASFFVDFNFQRIADFYHHSSIETRDLFEKLGMIILAPKEALEKGFISIGEEILEL